MKIFIILIAVIASSPTYAGLQGIAARPEMRDSLRLIAFDGRCSYFVSTKPKAVSPSTSDSYVWETCWGHISQFIGSISLGPDYGSAIYQVRVDCSLKQYAIVDSVGFNNQLWEGGELRLVNSPEPWWRKLSGTFSELQNICAGGGLTQFDGPESNKSL